MKYLIFACLHTNPNTAMEKMFPPSIGGSKVLPVAESRLSRKPDFSNERERSFSVILWPSSSSLIARDPPPASRIPREARKPRREGVVRRAARLKARCSKGLLVINCLDSRRYYLGLVSVISSKPGNRLLKITRACVLVDVRRSSR